MDGRATTFGTITSDLPGYQDPHLGTSTRSKSLDVTRNNA
ncbi:hypothetical protein AH4AK4_1181 [Aeromonas hydrophila 4AK4]|nr:hypothetical protein AH4AK4_1181 [Aeromonas hydrophila 4AK4]